MFINPKWNLGYLGALDQKTGRRSLKVSVADAKRYGCKIRAVSSIVKDTVVVQGRVGDTESLLVV
jgi:hypothetical protein